VILESLDSQVGDILAMLKIVTLKGKQRETHIARGTLSKSAFCGCKFKRTRIAKVVEGNIELCSCKRCIKNFNANIHLFEN
jgi:hypothetical protein